MQSRIEYLENENLKLRNELSTVQISHTTEMTQMQERIFALEEMVNTMNELFEAKLKKITTHPNISKLLR